MANVGDQIRHLLSFIEGSGEVIQSVRSELRELEADMDKPEARHNELMDRAEAVASKVVEGCREELEEALNADPQDRAQANTAFRVPINHVVIDYEIGVLAMQWCHGGETEIPYAWPGVDSGE